MAPDLERYGQQWPQHPRENKFSIPTSTITTPEVYSEMISGANFQVISVRGAEIVSGARTLKEELVLLYTKLTGHQLALVLRSKDAKLTDVASTALKHLFAQK